MLKFTIPILTSVALLAACASQAPAPSYEPMHERSAPMQPVQLATPSPTVAHHVVYSADLQTALAHKGYYHGRIDGNCGPATRTAIAHYQHDLGVPVTGHCQVGDKVWSGLGLSAGGTAPHDPSAPHQRHLYLQ